MKNVIAPLIAFALLGTVSSYAPAQDFFTPGNIGMYTALSGGWGWGGYGGGTADGNFLNGMSQVIRAEGDYNLNTSAAYMNIEAARTRYIENKRLWTQAYYAMREQNEVRRAEILRRTKYSPETLAIAAHSSAPKPLGQNVLDPLTGSIQWPEALMDSRFDQHRRTIEQLLEMRAATYGSRTHSQALANATREMIATLKENIHELPVGEYIAARKFLDRLAVSA